jgi:outer membrane protein OmpA-like peptidoglycan-associated protein
MNSKFLISSALALALAAPAFAQYNTPDTSDDVQPVNDSAHIPVYRVNVTERTTKAVDYRHKGGTTKLDFMGTTLMPEGGGDADVKSHTGRIEIEAHFNHLESPQKFGPQYLTYVLWAITPEGRPVNLGEVVLKHKHDRDAEVHVTSNLQAFGMIVTAEPYYAVTRPSDQVVLENVVRPDTKADIVPITARYEALGRNEYTVDLNPADLPATSADDKTPTNLLEAENAIAIAKASGAEQYAAGPLQKAQDELNQAENAWRNHQNDTAVGTPARSAAQMAEDARVITIRKKHDEQLATERREARERTEEARARAEAATQQADEAKLEAQHQQQARAQADADRQAALQAQQQAEAAAEQARVERQQADEAKQQAIAQQQQLAAQTQQAQLQAQQAEQARAAAERQVQETRQRLTDQLNQVLQTRQTARGLIVNMSDVLFDTGKASLKPGARVRLAKVAGIIMAYPDLKLEIDGYTDSIGSDNFNRELSQQRADTVRSFLASQGVPDGSIVTRGYGKEDPIASNDTASGRQMNRRVELVVSGNAIGTNAAVPAPVTQPSAIGNSANPQ